MQFAYTTKLTPISRRQVRRRYSYVCTTIGLEIVQLEVRSCRQILARRQARIENDFHTAETSTSALHRKLSLGSPVI